jgi:hypothetical protein
MVLLLWCGLNKPGFEAGVEDEGVRAGKECAFLDEGTEVASLGSATTSRGSPRKLRPLRISSSRPNCSGPAISMVPLMGSPTAVCNRAGDRVSCDGLDERLGKANRVAVGCGVGDALDELEELGRMHDRIGDSLVSFSCVIFARK